MPETLDPKAMKALGTVDWTRILPCGHPGQRFAGLGRQPPCAECSPGPMWWGAEAPSPSQRWWMAVSKPAATAPPRTRCYGRVTLTVTANGHSHPSRFWWPLTPAEESNLKPWGEDRE